MDKKDLIIAHLKNENDGLYLAYGEISARLRLEEAENKDLKEKLKGKDNDDSQKSDHISSDDR